MIDEPDKGRRPLFKRRDDRQRPAGGERNRDGQRPFAKRDERPAEDAPAGERIAKRLARAGISSRREAEGLIADGRVRVNGQVLSSPAFNVQPGDRIELDGNPIPEPERTRLFLFHKPAGLVTTNRDPEGRQTVFDALPEGLPRLMTVGRLDINTEGLLLLTNDGGLARVLELPDTGWLRRYRVRVHGAVDEEKLKGLREGIAVDGVFYGAIEAELERTQGSNAWLTLGLREGKNREVKNVLGALGLEVNRLIRVSFGPFQLGELEEGQVQEIKGRTLRDQLGERLIEESGADFEADIRQPFSNRPTARGQEPAEPASRREPARPEPGEGGLIKNRKRERERFREDGLQRLGTRPDRPGGFNKGFGGKGFGAKSFGKGFADKKRDPEERYEPRPRSANVWMGPGARPQGAKAAATPPRPVRQESERPFKPRGPRLDREGERKSWEGREPRRDAGAPGADERRPWQPRERRSEAGGDAQAPQREFRSRPPREGENRGADRSSRGGEHREGRQHFEGENRPPRREGERPHRRADDRPRENRGAEGRPFRERPSGDRPGEQPRSFPGEGRPEGGRPFRSGPRAQGGAEPFRGKPRAGGGERPFNDKPPRAGPRPEGGAKTFRDKPRAADGERPFNKRPRPAGGDRPERREGKPSGTRPSGDKPGGRPGGGGAKRPFKPRGGR